MGMIGRWRAERREFWAQRGAVQSACSRSEGLVILTGIHIVATGIYHKGLHDPLYATFKDCSEKNSLLRGFCLVPQSGDEFSQFEKFVKVTSNKKKDED